MMSKHTESASDLNRHILFLGRIYTFLGWLGLFGSAVLLLAMLSPAEIQATGAQVGGLGNAQSVTTFLLICWSILLLNFARDITGERKWSTGIAGFCIGLLNLLSVPVGTAVGGYTLWILFMQARMRRRQAP